MIVVATLPYQIRPSVRLFVRPSVSLSIRRQYWVITTV